MSTQVTDDFFSASRWGEGEGRAQSLFWVEVGKIKKINWSWVSTLKVLLKKNQFHIYNSQNLQNTNSTRTQYWSWSWKAVCWSWIVFGHFGMNFTCKNSS